MLPLCTSTLCRVCVCCIRAFDVDLLYQAECHRLPIGEIAVKWQEIDGSRLVSLSFACCVTLFALQFNLHISILKNVKIVYIYNLYMSECCSLGKLMWELPLSFLCVHVCYYQ